MVSYVVLDSGAVANSIDITQRCSDQTQMGIGLESMFVVLPRELLRKPLSKFGLSCPAIVSSWLQRGCRTSVLDSQTPVDHRQKPIGSSFVTSLPSSICVNNILSGWTSLTRALVKTSTDSCAKRAF